MRRSLIQRIHLNKTSVKRDLTSCLLAMCLYPLVFYLSFLAYRLFDTIFLYHIRLQSTGFGYFPDYCGHACTAGLTSGFAGFRLFLLTPEFFFLMWKVVLQDAAADLFYFRKLISNQLLSLNLSNSIFTNSFPCESAPVLETSLTQYLPLSKAVFI